MTGLPDHVTRYHHRYESRWLVPPAEVHRFSWDALLMGVGYALSTAGLMTAVVFAVKLMRVG